MKTLKQRRDDGDIVFGATVCEHLHRAREAATG
jgi:hypothetical protein